MSELYEGPWTVIEATSMENKSLMKSGEIMRHSSGAIVLTCPKCRAMQFVAVRILGSDEKPTLSKPIQCGGGHCKRCAIWFKIEHGKTVEAEPVIPKEAPITSAMKRAGVYRPQPLVVKPLED